MAEVRRIKEILRLYNRRKGRVFGIFKKDCPEIKRLKALIKPFHDYVEIDDFEILRCFCFDGRPMSHSRSCNLSGDGHFVLIQLVPIVMPKMTSDIFIMLSSLKQSGLFEEKYINLLKSHDKPIQLWKAILELNRRPHLLTDEILSEVKERKFPDIYVDYLAKLEKSGLNTAMNRKVFFYCDTYSYQFKSLDYIDFTHVFIRLEQMDQALFDALCENKGLSDINPILYILDQSGLITLENIHLIARLDERNRRSLLSILKIIFDKFFINQEMLNDVIRLLSMKLICLCEQIDSKVTLTKSNFKLLLDQPDKSISRLSRVFDLFNNYLNISWNKIMIDEMLCASDLRMFYCKYCNQSPYSAVAPYLYDLYMDCSHEVVFSSMFKRLKKLDLLNMHVLGDLIITDSCSTRVELYEFLSRYGDLLDIKFINRVDHPHIMLNTFKYLSKNQLDSKENIAVFCNEKCMCLLTCDADKLIWSQLGSIRMTQKILSEIISRACQKGIDDVVSYVNQIIQQTNVSNLKNASVYNLFTSEGDVGCDKVSGRYNITV